MFSLPYSEGWLCRSTQWCWKVHVRIYPYFTKVLQNQTLYVLNHFLFLGVFFIVWILEFYAQLRDWLQIVRLFPWIASSLLTLKVTFFLHLNWILFHFSPKKMPSEKHRSMLIVLIFQMFMVIHFAGGGSYISLISTGYFNHGQLVFLIPLLLAFS